MAFFLLSDEFCNATHKNASWLCGCGGGGGGIIAVFSISSSWF